MDRSAVTQIAVDTHATVILRHGPREYAALVRSLAVEANHRHGLHLVEPLGDCTLADDFLAVLPPMDRTPQ